MMANTRPTTSSDEEEKGQNFHRHLHHHHLKAIVVMLGFTFAQFFFMGFVVSAGELTIKALLECTNLMRLDHSRPNELVMNEKLTEAAENKLADMAQYKYWAHQNPVTGRQPWDFVDSAGYYYETTGENLAYGFTDSQKICDAWEKSPKHLANITDPTFEEIGFAVDKANLHKNEKGILVVQMFGSRDDFTQPSGEQNGTREKTQETVHEAAPEVKGASAQKTAPSSGGDDSVRPRESLPKLLLPYGIGVSLLLGAAATAMIFRYKKNKKKVKLMKNVAVIFFGIAVILTLLVFFSPSL